MAWLHRPCLKLGADQLDHGFAKRREDGSVLPRRVENGGDASRRTVRQLAHGELKFIRDDSLLVKHSSLEKKVALFGVEPARGSDHGRDTFQREIGEKEGGGGEGDCGVV